MTRARARATGRSTPSPVETRRRARPRSSAGAEIDSNPSWTRNIGNGRGEKGRPFETCRENETGPLAPLAPLFRDLETDFLRKSEKKVAWRRSVTRLSPGQSSTTRDARFRGVRPTETHAGPADARTVRTPRDPPKTPKERRAYGFANPPPTRRGAPFSPGFRLPSLIEKVAPTAAHASLTPLLSRSV